MRLNTQSSLFTLLLVVAVMIAAPAVAMQDDGDKEHQTTIHIQREGGGEGEETVGRHHVMFIDEDGETQEIEGEGVDFSWTQAEGGRHYRMRMPGFAMRDGAFLGVSTTRMTSELRSHFGAPEGAGVLVSKVVENSAAFSAGIQVGDIITSVDSESIESPGELLHVIRSRDEGDTVTVEVYREGKVQALSAVLGKTELHGAELGEGPHFRHFRGLPHGMSLDCAEDGGDCDIRFGRRHEICGDEEECDIDISCGDGACTCSLNGEQIDCKELHGRHRRHR